MLAAPIQNTQYPHTTIPNPLFIFIFLQVNKTFYQKHKISNTNYIPLVLRQCIKGNKKNIIRKYINLEGQGLLHTHCALQIFPNLGSLKVLYSTLISRYFPNCQKLGYILEPHMHGEVYQRQQQMEDWKRSQCENLGRQVVANFNYIQPYQLSHLGGQI